MLPGTAGDRLPTDVTPPGSGRSLIEEPPPGSGGSRADVPHAGSGRSRADVKPGAGSARRMRADARRNRQVLLDAAIEAFAEHGADAPLDGIAKRAGVANATLYRHFPTREALLEEVLGERIGQLVEGEPALVSRERPADALAAWLGEFVAYTRTYQGLPASVLATLRGEPGSPLYGSCATLLGVAARLLERAQSAGEVRCDVDAVDLLTQATGIAWATERGPRDATRADRLLIVLMDGLRATAGRNATPPR
ncbi:TetR/AcrR family transcriptional regulator [Microbispora sp. NPDC088329]|uniref:TetR/AcrR family transcriptional regulator n=1 Tax=Microbispora sp. NPDC088329 TaxID=3154869 RepID=UPI00342FC90F